MVLIIGAVYIYVQKISLNDKGEIKPLKESPFMAMHIKWANGRVFCPQFQSWRILGVVVKDRAWI